MQQIIIGHGQPEPMNCSHWGLFECAGAPFMLVPKGFHILSQGTEEWNKPGAIVHLQPEWLGESYANPR